MMSQNRQSQRDRIQAEEDYQTNLDAKLEIEELTKRLNSIEVNKLDKIIKMLEEMKKNKLAADSQILSVKTFWQILYLIKNTNAIINL